jgi:two-component system phosphate regulon sensor histidine kinase PhoR
MRLLHRIRRRIAIKLTLTLVGFVAVAGLSAGLYLNHALKRFAEDALESRLAATGRVLLAEARAVLARTDDAPGGHLFATRASRSSGARVTLIAPDGRVLAESHRALGELPQVENHASRPEVRSALAGRVGRDIRRSVTVDTPLLYVAVPVEDGDRVVGVLRLALPLTEVSQSYRVIHEVMLAGGLIALVVAAGIGVFVSGRVTRPVVDMQSIARRMSEGDFAARAPVRSPDEIGRLGRALNVLAARLRDQLDRLTQEQGKVQALLDTMVEGVIGVDARDHVILINERARRLFALSAGRVEGRPFLEVVRHPGLREAFRDGRAVAPGTVVRREVRLAGPPERIVQVHAAPLPLGGEGAGVALVLHDISELRRLEQIRTEFIANLSHELRTPLTAIQGFLETLIGGAMDEPEHARRFLEIVFRHTERLGRLLSDLTDLSNIELGRIALRLEPVDLEDLIASVVDIIRPKAAAGGVQLETQTDAGLPPLQADRDRLAQILINVVDNAVKYTPLGGRVRVSAARDDDRVEIAVADTGVGIPAADLPRITERFYRVDKARSRELGGTGLGLAIVKHLVAAHGGELHITSEPDIGTTVRVTLPLAVAPVVLPDAASTP